MVISATQLRRSIVTLTNTTIKEEDEELGVVRDVMLELSKVGVRYSAEKRTAGDTLRHSLSDLAKVHRALSDIYSRILRNLSAFEVALSQVTVKRAKDAWQKEIDNVLIEKKQMQLVMIEGQEAYLACERAIEAFEEGNKDWMLEEIKTCTSSLAKTVGEMKAEISLQKKIFNALKEIV